MLLLVVNRAILSDLSNWRTTFVLISHCGIFLLYLEVTTLYREEEEEEEEFTSLDMKENMCNVLISHSVIVVM